jgi:maleate isomerase
MTDRLGWRLKLGVLVPAFNTTVQPELENMRPPGVTNHVARIEMPDLPLTSNDDQEMVVRSLGDDLFGAMRRVMIAKPAAVILGISIPTFWGGVEGAGALLHRLEDAAGVPCIMGSVASVRALRLYPECTRLGVLTPYQPIADAQVSRYLSESGFSPRALVSLRRPSNLEISHADEVMLRGGLDELVAAGCDIILQVGTNLAMSDLVEMESARIGMPIISINTALYWQALRRMGIDDRITGFGPLLAGH